MEGTRQHLTEGAAIDLFVAYRFLRILTTPWEKQPAFKHGIIDKNGKLLRKRKELTTSEEKNSFTLLHRLIFNLKRILHKIPLVKTKLGTYATALFLLKQHFSDQVEDEEIIYTGKSTNNLTGCTRGLFNTAKKSHINTSNVFQAQEIIYPDVLHYEVRHNIGEIYPKTVSTNFFPKDPVPPVIKIV